MKEYIERATALDICQKEYEDRLRMADYCGDTVAWNIGGAIKSLPAANVAEVRHGRWNPEICESISKRNRLIEYKVYSCSLCGRSNGRVKKKYCPNCGALMKEDEYEAG
jgi:rubrerythrin|nr:MAG TPA: hypothetical protein [Caudoviricetes sp.]